MVQGKAGEGKKEAADTKWQRRDIEERLNKEAELIELDLPEDLLARVGVEEDSETEQSEDNSDSEDEEDCEITDNEEEPVEVDTSALEILMVSSRQIGYDAFEDNTTTFHYQRSTEPSIGTLQRQVKNLRELQEAAKNTRTLETYFQRPAGKQANPVTFGRATPCMSTEERQRNERDAAIKSIKKKIESKKMGMNGQNLMRHQAVLAFLQIQKSKKLGETREHLALRVARCYGKGIYFTRRIVAWEREWMEDGVMQTERKQGCYTKTKSWFWDEGMEQAVREWLSGRSGKVRAILFKWDRVSAGVHLGESGRDCVSASAGLPF
ncbi:hypothetical protein FN846DRAFT_886778 [Sphaerosporella brunnea]|uniref:Uncharacterized protein n=1 Tax=Sphaerosporella brunnea TaxID=1250544 RepID=A0A5J5F7W8_9PEZI|nr:hypothetical protein FN846DRAFT_886778 [Sphaerosporella brunnea]